MLHIKKLMGMHNKETYARIYVYVCVYMRICAHIDIRVYAEYVCMICVCVVRLHLSCTVKVILEFKRSDGKITVNEQDIITDIRTFSENLCSSNIERSSNDFTV